MAENYEDTVAGKAYIAAEDERQKAYKEEHKAYEESLRENSEKAAPSNQYAEDTEGSSDKEAAKEKPVKGSTKAKG